MGLLIEEPDRVELVTNREALAQVEDEWRRLAAGLGNPFVTPEWFWSSLGQDGAEPLVAVVWHRDGSLRGLLPFTRVANGRRRRARFGGANLADHLEPVAVPGDRAAVVRAAATVLDLAKLGCPTLVLDNVDSEPAWWDELATAAPSPLVAKLVKGSVLPYADIAEMTWEEYLSGRSRNFRRDIRRKLDRLQRSREIEFRRTRTDDDLAGDLDSLYRLHDARWAGGASSAAGGATRRVLSAFAAASLARGWLRLWVLSVDGAPAAALMQWRLGSRVSSYYTGFDPSLQGEGVGLLLTAHSLRAAIEEGAGEFSMLLGDEPWKERFSTDKRRVSTVVLVRAHHPARILVSAETGARRALERLPASAQRRARALARPIGGALPGVRRR